jgi:hypothetical protein
MAADDLLANQPDDSNVQAQDGGGFGRFYDSYMQCEMLMERLKFLNYENEFVPLSDSLKVIPRYVYGYDM